MNLWKDILSSPKEYAGEPEAQAVLQLVLEKPQAARRRKLIALTLLCTALVVIAGLIVWIWGYRTQQGNPGFWHVSLVAMLFWLSVSQGMMAVSAILRVSHASWRYPITRILDIGSLFGLWVCALLPLLVVARQRIYDLGSSPYRDSVWRVAGSTFFDALTVGIAYAAGWAMLYLTSLPDFAMLRDRAAEGSKQRAFYERIAGFWNGADRQWREMRLVEGVMVVGVLISFVASQTVLGWDFQLASARDWDSSIFAPLYTVGSLLSALAMTTLVMTVVRRVLPRRTPELFETRVYDNLGRFMLGLGLVWFYFRWCDYLTAWYGHVPEEWAIQNNRVLAFPILAGLMVFGCFIAPVFGCMINRIRTSPAGLCIVSVFVLIGIAVQRYLDTVPTFAPRYPLAALLPSVASVTVFGGLAAMFVLTYLLAARYFPIISWWGMGKERTRKREIVVGNSTVIAMVEDPPVWET